MVRAGLVGAGISLAQRRVVQRQGIPPFPYTSILARSERWTQEELSSCDNVFHKYIAHLMIVTE